MMPIQVPAPVPESLSDWSDELAEAAGSVAVGWLLGAAASVCGAALVVGAGEAGASAACPATSMVTGWSGFLAAAGTFLTSSPQPCAG